MSLQVFRHLKSVTVRIIIRIGPQEKYTSSVLLLNDHITGHT